MPDTKPTTKDWLTLLKQPVSYAAFHAMQEMARALEELPILWDAYGASLVVGDFGVMGFKLTDDGWIPAKAIEVNDENGWATLGLYYEDGATETVPCRPGTWAHATMDGTPNLPGVWHD